MLEILYKFENLKKSFGQHFQHFHLITTHFIYSIQYNFGGNRGNRGMTHFNTVPQEVFSKYKVYIQRISTIIVTKKRPLILSRQILCILNIYT